MLRLGINRSLLAFGLLQAVSTAGFALLSLIGPSVAALGGVIAFENLSAGMGTAAYMGFMASLTDKRFTATQYALLTSFMGFSRDVITSPTGFMAKSLGWLGFFILCTLLALPGLVMLLKFSSWQKQPAGGGR
jgi:PAT family beta-lactamase induction signal transducer AmpG